MAQALWIVQLLLGAWYAAGVSLHQGQPELYQPPTTPPITDDSCPFYQRCGEDCVGTEFLRKQLSPEVLERLASFDADHKVMASFSMYNDISADLGLACKYNLTVHEFDPRPNSPAHMNQVHLLLGTMETTHPVVMPAHEACWECTTYWDDVSHSQMGAHQVLHHQLTVGPSDNSSITLHETLDDNWKVLARKGIKAGGQNLTMPAVSVLSALRSQQIPRVDVVRIDMDGLELSLLEQVVSLPPEMRPGIIFAQLPSVYEWTCKGEGRECLEWKKQTKSLISWIKSQGYTFQLYHKMDFIFLKK